MNILKIIVCVSCLALTSNLFADADQEAFERDYDATVLKANKMSNKEIMREIGFIYDMNKNKDTFEAPLKLAPYVSVISEREKAGDTEAKFISTSLLKIGACEMMVEQKMHSIGDTCIEVINNLKEVANLKSKNSYVPASMAALGDIYYKGVVTNKSDLLSAEWYYKAAKKYNELGNRDETVRSLEKSLQSNPNYKPAKIYLNSIVGN